MPHTGVVLSGQWHFEMDDGSSFDLEPGDAYAIPPGHDAWVVGDEPVRTLDWAPAHDDATEGAIDAATRG
jgi:quercetin dioxygenase-like cupin family protein